MSDNYIVINGKRTELSEEQLKLLGIEPRKNPFNKVKSGDKYWFISHFGNINGYTQLDYADDNTLFEICNYFNDLEFAKQVALHQLLYRKLLKFAYDNRCEDTAEWRQCTQHWNIYYCYVTKRFCVDEWSTDKYAWVYFSSKEAAEHAIEEVVIPFMKEHPDFVW